MARSFQLYRLARNLGYLQRSVARRSRRRRRSGPASREPILTERFWILIGVIALIWAFNASGLHLNIVIVLSLLAAAISLGLWWWYTRVIPRNLESIVKSIVQVHAKTLSRKRDQLRRRDDYGNLVDKKWREELDTFLDWAVVPKLGEEYLSTFLKRREQITHDLIEPMLDEIGKATQSPAHIDPASLSPIDYEVHCAKVLSLAGWSAQTTKATGDQGADVIAEKDGTRIVLQCKKYSQPVGNKAVQEAFAAMRFQRAQYAAVVSNADYTPSARQLAATNGVLLLHHEDLPDLAEIISR